MEVPVSTSDKVAWVVLALLAAVGSRPIWQLWRGDATMQRRVGNVHSLTEGWSRRAVCLREALAALRWM
jgi:hypothetical protein